MTIGGNKNTINSDGNLNRNNKKNDMANTNNYCNVLTQYIHYIPYVHTIIDYNDVYPIYH